MTSRHAVDFQPGYSHDVDHITDLQVGGADTASNMWHLESGVNRSEGAQLSGLLRRTPVTAGSAFRSFSFTDRGAGLPETVSMIGHVSRVGGAVVMAVP